MSQPGICNDAHGMSTTTEHAVLLLKVWTDEAVLNGTSLGLAGAITLPNGVLFANLRHRS
jgi:hypothetical protein